MGGLTLYQDKAYHMCDIDFPWMTKELQQKQANIKDLILPPIQIDMKNNMIRATSLETLVHRLPLMGGSKCAFCSASNKKATSSIRSIQD